MKEINEDTYYVDKDFDDYGTTSVGYTIKRSNDDDDSSMSWDVFSDMNRNESKFYPKSWR